MIPYYRPITFTVSTDIVQSSDAHCYTACLSETMQLQKDTHTSTDVCNQKSHRTTCRTHLQNQSHTITITANESKSMTSGFIGRTHHMFRLPFAGSLSVKTATCVWCRFYLVKNVCCDWFLFQSYRRYRLLQGLECTRL